jgi:hypothetical protein
MALGRNHEAVIAVRNDYLWNLNPESGEFIIYIDGRCAGRAALEATEEIPVAPGTHTVRVRLWWFFSHRMTVDVDPGSAVYFRADIPRNGNFLFRMMKGMFDPFHFLVLEEVKDGSGPLPVP